MRHGFNWAAAVGAGATILVGTSAALARPAGDECADAIVAIEGVNNFDTTLMTPSANPPENGSCTFLDWNNSQDIWFAWTPSASGTAVLSLCNSAFDTSVVVYEGTTCANAIRIACDDDTCGSTYQSIISGLGVYTDKTYYIRIGGWQGAVGVGSMEITLSPISSGCIGATGSCGQVHAGTGCDDPICCDAVCAANPLCCDLGWDEQCVSDAVQICGIFNYVCLPGGPANDCAPNATVVTDGQVVPFNTVGANTDGPPDSADVCGSGAAFPQIDHDLWYRFLATANGSATISNCNTGTFDSKIALYDIGDWASFDPSNLPDYPIACNEDGPNCENFTSLLTTTVIAGRTYLARLGGYNGLSGTGTLSFDLPDPCLLPASTVNENEACGGTANDGCNATGTPVQAIALGDSVGGTFWATGGTRDTDWYQFTVTQQTNVTWSVYSASLVAAFIVDTACPPSILATATGACPSAASICLQPGTYRAFAAISAFEGVPCGSGALNDYVGTLSGAPAVCPTAGDVCENPGPNTVTQNTSNALTAGGTACAGGGITTANSFARNFSGLTSGELRCVEFGFSNSGAAIAATLGVYRDTNADGLPLTLTSADLVLLASREFILPTTAGNVFITASFPEPICLDGNTSNIAVVLDVAASTTGFAAYSGNTASDGTTPTYLKAPACGAGFNDFVPMPTVSATAAKWVVNVNGDFSKCGGAPCVGDLTGDGMVDAADLGILLGAWGGTGPANLDGVGVVDAADLGILLGAWGPCP